MQAIANPPQISVIEKVTLGSYYLVTCGINCMQAVVKLASIAFSFLATLPFMQKSAILKTWVHAHNTDFKIATKLVKYSWRGIRHPVEMTHKIHLLNAQSVNDLGRFEFDMVNRVTTIEKFGICLQFVVNLVKEVFSFICAGIRYIAALLGKMLHFEQSELFNSILFHEFFLLSGHSLNAFGSLEGILFPQEANFSLVKQPYKAT